MYAATALALRSHLEFNQDKQNYGRPKLRKSGELYAWHMVRILEWLNESDKPYIGLDGYLATWLHDTIEDTKLTKEDIARVFGQRVAEIVEILSNLKNSNWETKLKQADSYEPFLIEKTPDYPEVDYIKLGDTQDYFMTCADLPPLSQYLHFRFVDELLYPLTVASVGAQKPALQVANLAMRTQRPGVYNQHQQKINAVLNEKSRELIVQARKNIERTLSQAGISATVTISYKTPYELFLKARKTKGVSQKMRFYFPTKEKFIPEDEFDQDINVIQEAAFDTLAGDFYKLTGVPSESSGQKPSLRDIVSFDITVSSESDCFEARKALSTAFQSLPERSRNFVANPKLNGYRALHEEFFDPLLAANHIRVRIAAEEMVSVNQQGLLAREIGPVPAKLLSQALVRKKQISDRDVRTALMQGLPDLRMVKIKVATPKPELPEFADPLVWHYDYILDAITLAHPWLALRLATAEWDGHRLSKRDFLPWQETAWYTGQEVTVTLERSWSGLDLYSLLQNQFARKRLKEYVGHLPSIDKVAIGKRMLKYAIRKTAALSPSCYN
ncbi:MAG: hypothetical protein ABIE84_04635 [bacterium]